MYQLIASLRFLSARMLSLVAVASVAFGVLTAVVVTAVFDGYLDFIKGRFREFSADLIVELPAGGDREGLRAALDELDFVTAATTELSSMALIQNESGLADRVWVRGCDREHERRFDRLQRFLVNYRASLLTEGEAPLAEGSPAYEAAVARLRKETVLDFRLDGAEPPHAPLLVGCRLLADLELEIGQRVILHTFSGERRDPVASLQCTVIGAFKTGYAKYDEEVVYGLNDDLARLFPPDSRQETVLARVAGGDLTDEQALAVASVALRHGGRRLQTWRDQNRALLKSIELQVTIWQVLLAFIFLVAGFNIFSIQQMIVREKIPEIGVLRSMGAGRRGILVIFLLNSFWYAVGGAIAGLAGSLLLLHNLEGIRAGLKAWTGVDPFPVKTYLVDHIPYRIEPGALALYACAAAAVCLLAALLPAFKAARQHPVEALRSYE